jgi:hypothetical protein
MRQSDRQIEPGTHGLRLAIRRRNGETRVLGRDRRGQRVTDDPWNGLTAKDLKDCDRLQVRSHRGPRSDRKYCGGGCEQQ